MDFLIRRFLAEQDRDLMICDRLGVAYQRDMSVPYEYGRKYFDNYVKLEGSSIADAINRGRVDIVNKWIGADARVLDVGIGSGEFIGSRPNTFGIDVNPVAKKWLQERDLYASGGVADFTAYTFWDVMEHVANPNDYFKRMPQGAHLFTCLPVFDDLRRVRESKHYKPNEHLYYWTERGFIEWMSLYRFRLLEVANFETEAGRENIRSFAFVRDLPTYHDTLDQYRKLHFGAYGTSAYLYFDEIAKQVLRFNPASILDFGCGRSDLAAHFWKDGKRKIMKYDPAIPQYEQLPDGPVDLVICCDVMEHIPIGDVERVLWDIRRRSRDAIFSIALKPARAKLPDGRNAHVTILRAKEWMRWIDDVFGRAYQCECPVPDSIIVRTFG